MTTTEDRLKDLARWLDEKAQSQWEAGNRAEGFSLHCQSHGVLAAIGYLPKGGPAIVSAEGLESVGWRYRYVVEGIAMPWRLVDSDEVNPSEFLPLSNQKIEWEWVYVRDVPSPSEGTP